MSRSTAWDIAGVSPGARSLAQQAADRAGVPLEQWLDEAIVGHAFDAGAVASARRAGGGAQGGPGPGEDIAVSAHAPFAGVQSARDLQERLKATAGPFTRRPADTAEQPSPDSPKAEASESALGPLWPPFHPKLAVEPPEPPLRGERPAGPEAFDLQSALNQIASRRRALDARLAHDGLQPRSAAASAGTGRLDQTPDGVGAASKEFLEALRSALPDLPERSAALRPEWRGAQTQARGSEARKDRAMAAVRADPIALPRRVPGDLTADPRHEPPTGAAPGLDESLLASVSQIALDLREALTGGGPAPFADLDRRIDALGAKIDALAGAVVREEVVEAVRRQMEVVHDLLIAAARRSLPLQRLDDQISRLVDQVERLTAGSLAIDGAQANAWIGLLRRPGRDVAPDPSLVSIDNRLAAIAGRLDEEGAAARAWLAAIAARLDAAEPTWVPALNRALAAAPEAAPVGDRERPDTAPLTGPDTGFGALPGASRVALDAELKAIRAGVERLGTVTAGDDGSAERLAEAIARRLETLFEAYAAPAAVSGRLAQIDSRLEVVVGRLDEVDALERAARDALDRLRDGDEAPASGVAAEIAAEIAALRRERSAADQRAEALLRGVQDVIDRLAGQLPGEPGRRREDVRRPANRVVSPAGVAELDTIDRPRPHPPGGPGVDRGPPPGSRPGEDELLEPGASAPERAASSPGPDQPAGARTNPAVSAHIAAARRAAAVAASGAEAETVWPKVERNVRHAGRFCATHKRSILIAAALALALAAAARLMTDHALVARLTGMEGPAPATNHPLSPGLGAAPHAPLVIDTSPTGSIGRDRTSPGAGAAGAPAATVPAGLPPPLRDAILAGSPAAEYELAQRLADGRGIDRDPAAAAAWFERAASAGLAPAAFRLGALYQKGVGVTRDLAAAKRWYTTAALAGNARAAHNLGALDAEPADDRADYAEAARWFRKAAQMGVRDSQFNLGVLAARGLGVEPDLRQAWLWFSLAAAQGDAEAGRKRDEVAARMDADGLAAAATLLAQFRPVAPDPAANGVPPASVADKAAPAQ